MGRKVGRIKVSSMLSLKTHEIYVNEILPWEYLARIAHVKLAGDTSNIWYSKCIFRVFQGSFHVIGTTVL